MGATAYGAQGLVRCHAGDLVGAKRELEPNTTRTWMAERGFDFPVLREERGAEASAHPKVVARRNDLLYYPETYFVDRDGRVQFRTFATLRHLVEEYTWRVEALLQPSSGKQGSDR
jgi:hypothetical protein